jgi:hypothetical protein
MRKSIVPSEVQYLSRAHDESKGGSFMVRLRELSLLLFIVSVTGCSPIKVGTDYDPTVVFTNLRTYAWMPEVLENPPVQNTILDSRIRLSVERQLTAQGYRKAAPQAADFHMAYHLTAREIRSLQTDYYDSGYYGGYRQGHRGVGYGGMVRAETYVTSYQEGTLVLDFVDPQTKKLIWRGTAQGEVDQFVSPEAKQEKLDKAVGLMLGQFPPQSK